MLLRKNLFIIQLATILHIDYGRFILNCKRYGNEDRRFVQYWSLVGEFSLSTRRILLSSSLKHERVCIIPDGAEGNKPVGQVSYQCTLKRLVVALAYKDNS